MVTGKSSGCYRSLCGKVLRQGRTEQRQWEHRSRSSHQELQDSLRCSVSRSMWQQSFMTMCVSALAFTTLDSVAAYRTYVLQELFSVDDMEHAEGWRKVLCNKYFATIITLVFGYILTQVGYSNIWPLFGSANQLLSALVLITLCVFLKVTGRTLKTLVPPFVIMLIVTFSALVQRFISLVKAFSAGNGSVHG